MIEGAERRQRTLTGFPGASHVLSKLPFRTTPRCPVVLPAPTPSAFYLVIQAALLAGGAGLVFSVDRWWASRRVRDPLAFMTTLYGVKLSTDYETF